MRKVILFGSVFFLICSEIRSQNIESINKKNWYNRSAALSIGYNFYNRDNQSFDSREHIFMIGFRGNLEIIGINIPVSFLYKNGKTYGGLSNPFYRFGISPTYKWITVHAGYRSMSFSNYSLNGVTFLGGGIDLRPGKFRASAMYGTIQVPNYVRDTSAFQANLLSGYKRKAWGVKLGIGKANNYIDLIYLNIEDKFNDGDISQIYTTLLPPAENRVYGLDLRLNFFRNFFIRSSINGSLLTDNIARGNDTIDDEITKVLRYIAGRSFTQNITTKAAFAADFDVSWRYRGHNIGVKYKRIDPSYRSLGTHYLLNDLENYTIGAGTHMWRHKISFNGSYGFQRNNLNQLRRNTSLRKIYNIDISFNPVKNAGVILSYSNYNFNQRSGLYQLNDTFRMVQSSNTLVIGPFYSWQGNNIHHNISVNYSKNTLNDVSPYIIDPVPYQSNAATVNYNSDLKAQRTGLGGSLIYSNDASSNYSQKRYGISLNARKKLNKPDINISGNVNYNILSRSEEQGRSISFNCNANWFILPRLNLGINGGYFNRVIASQDRLSEIRGSVLLTYDLLKPKKNEK